MLDFKFADIGEGISEGVILKWEKNVGDKVNEGETLVVIETDKVNAEIPSPISGLIKKIGPNVGEIINVGETIALIDDGDESAVASSGEKQEEEESTGVVGAIDVSSEVIETSTENKIKETNTFEKALATPVARKMARDFGVDINKINGTGENGRVMKADILAFSSESDKNETKQVKTISSPNVSLPKFDTNRTRREKTSKLRQTIAKNMSLSKSIIPHTTVMDEVIVSELVDFRNTHKEKFASKGVTLTYMPFIIKALTLAIKDFPIFNSSYDHETKEVIYKNYMNIGIATDTPDGLIVPNIKDSDKKGIFALASELNRLKAASMDKKITLQDLNDGTISITNYGIFDSTFGAPVIKYPEVSIIGIGRIGKKPVVINDEIVIKYVLPLSLSIDHRVIDGGDAGRFLKTFKTYLKDPMMLLLS